MDDLFFAHTRDRTWKAQPVSSEVIEFHRSFSDYNPTELRELALPSDHQVFMKVENSRFGLPAFKALGASWALSQAIKQRDIAAPKHVTTASDGNHGRAVAHFAKRFGYQATIFIPSGVTDAAIEGIRSEGAEAVVMDCSYDDAVDAARKASEAKNWLLLQDMAWEGYEASPKDIVDGYSTLFFEIDSQLRGKGISHPDLVLVPTGVGSLLQAAVEHYRSDDSKTAVVSVEAENAACMKASLLAGHPVTVETSLTIMAGLNCGTPSSLAWPAISRGLDGVVHVREDQALDAIHALQKLSVDSGPCGSSSLAGYRTIATDADALSHLNLRTGGVVILVSTEGMAANPITER